MFFDDFTSPLAGIGVKGRGEIQHKNQTIKKVCHELKGHQDFCNKKINQYLKDSKKYPLAKYTNIIQNYGGAKKHAENLIHEIQKIMTQKHTPTSKHFDDTKIDPPITLLYDAYQLN